MSKPQAQERFNLNKYLQGLEKHFITRALQKTKGNRTQAAALLGISFRRIRYRMKVLHIKFPKN